MNIKYRQLLESSQKSVNQFYKRFKQNVSCNRSDAIFTATKTTNNAQPTHLIAAVIIRQLDDILLLRSLFVNPEYRQQKVASKLTKMAIESTNQEIFCLCQPELTDFYRQFDFRLYHQPTNIHIIDQQIKKGHCLMQRPRQLF